MDYEKKYNEALKRAKAVMDMAANQDEARGIATTIFPELRESEDEKAYKRIEQLIRLNTSGAEKTHLLAYLEKQKDLFRDDTKMVEQKPAEWDDYTKTNLDRAIQIIKKAKGTLQGYQSDDGIYECDKAIECLEHFLYRGLEIENPAGWSEEDERMRNQLIYDFERYKKEGLISAKQNKATKALYDGIEKCYDEKIAWLKSLRPQPHWKPSEQEKGALRTAIHILTEERSFPKAASHLQAILDTFDGKEFRKDWRPSAEQINYLGAAVIEAQRRHNESTDGFPRYRVLKELYEQLLKL